MCVCVCIGVGEYVCVPLRICVCTYISLIIEIGKLFLSEYKNKKFPRNVYLVEFFRDFGIKF